jgi:hypothetical protein
VASSPIVSGCYRLVAADGANSDAYLVKLDVISGGFKDFTNIDPLDPREALSYHGGDGHG